jgi:hypothetical protein
MRQSRKWLAIAPMALVASCVLAAALAGCGPGDVVGLLANPAEESSSPVTPRLTGGSVPGGEIVCGYIVPDYGTVGVRSAGADDAPVVVSLVSASGETQSDGADEDGWFGFAWAKPGKSRLEFAPPTGGETTTVTVNVKGDHRVQVISGFVPGTERPKSRWHRKIRLESGADTVEVGCPEPVIITASIDGERRPDAQLVWVMETTTDCKLVPTSAPDTVLLYAGSTEGGAEIRAELLNSKSKKLKIRVIEPDDG